MMPAVAPDGSVWIGEMDTDTLTRLRPDDDAIQQIRLTGGYNEIMGLAVDRAGRVWVAEEHAQTLGMVDPSTGQQHQYPLPGNSPAPVGVAVGPDGDVWFTAMNGDWVGRFAPGTGHITRYPIPTAGALPYWLAVSPDGDVWFTEFGAGKVGQLDPRTGHIDEFALPTGSNPAGIAVAPTGTVWAATIQGRLARVKDGRVDTFPLPAADDYGVAVSASGTVWVGVAAGGAVYAFNPVTATSRRVPLDAKSTAWWLAADGIQVWVAMSSPAGSALAELPTGDAT
jgi:virginiamycin B lyase